MSRWSALIDQPCAAQFGHGFDDARSANARHTAGPDGGSNDKPVGTVAIALCDRIQSWVQVVQLSQRSRNLVRTMSCAVALDMLRRRLLCSDPLVTYPFVPAGRAYREEHRA